MSLFQKVTVLDEKMLCQMDLWQMTQTHSCVSIVYPIQPWEEFEQSFQRIFAGMSQGNFQEYF